MRILQQFVGNLIGLCIGTYLSKRDLLKETILLVLTGYNIKLFWYAGTANYSYTLV